MNLQVTADSPAGDEARMIRNVEVAEIPVFQFGVFSQSDLSYFPGPNFDFAGPRADQRKFVSGGRRRGAAHLS